MKVNELKAHLEQADDDAEVVIQLDDWWAFHEIARVDDGEEHERVEDVYGKTAVVLYSR